MSNNEFFDLDNNIEESSGEENSPETAQNTDAIQQEQQPTAERGNTENIKINHTYVTYIPYGLTPKTFEEHKSIKKVAKAAGGSFLAQLGIILMLNFALVVVMQILSFSFTDAVLFLQDPAVLQAEQIIFSILSFTLPFIVVYKIAGYRISDLIEFKKPMKGTILPFFLFGVGFCVFANIATSYAGSFFQSFGINYDVDFGESPKGVFGFLLSLISTVIVPALVEEFACRGIILGSLRKFGDGFAVMVSAILFGVMHGNFEQIPFAFLVGLVLGFVTVQSGSIWIAVVIHAFNNSISLIFDYFLGNFSNTAQNIIYIIFLCVSMLVGIAALLLLKKNNSDIYKFTSAEEMECTESQKYKWFFSSAVIIIFIVLSVLESLTFFII